MIETCYDEETIPYPANGRIGPFLNSSTVHACIQAKSLNMAQEVWDAPALPDNDSRSVTGDRTWEEFYSRFDGLAGTPLPTSRSMAHLGTGSVVSLRDEREANG